MLQINVHDKTIQLDDLIQAAKRGEEVVIVTDEQETFRLVQVNTPKKARKAGSAKGIIEIAEDFDAQLEDFKDLIVNKVDTPKKKFREFGTAKGQFSMSNDFDAPIDDFKDYMS